MQDCGARAGCQAALLSSLQVEKLEPILDTPQTHGRSSTLSFSSATLAIWNIWIPDSQHGLDVVWTLLLSLHHSSARVHQH